jgi:hypothetical protein
MNVTGTPGPKSPSATTLWPFPVSVVLPVTSIVAAVGWVVHGTLPAVNSISPELKWSR